MLLRILWVVGVLLFVGCGKSPNQPSSSAPAPGNRAELEKKAAQGDGPAQNALGKIYLEGRRSEQTQAVRWFQAAAGQGIVEAQYYLGMMAEAGRGVPRDETNALQWYLKAAEHGHADAQYSLALMYATGRGTDRQKEESVRWFRAAADQGLAEAQFNLAQRYQYGQGVASNLVEAYKWFGIAGRGGIPDAKKMVADLKPLLTSDQISQAEAGAAAFKPRHN